MTWYCVTERPMSPLVRDARSSVPSRSSVSSHVPTASGPATPDAIVAVAAPAVLETLRHQRPEPATNPPSLPIAGTYTMTIASPSGVADPEAVGTWLLTLGSDGTLDLASLTNGDIGRSITQYQVTERELLTTALIGSACPGVGRYTWTRTGSTLTFVVVSDACPLRSTIFSSNPWTTT